MQKEHPSEPVQSLAPKTEQEYGIVKNDLTIMRRARGTCRPTSLRCLRRLSRASVK